ncbi:hypothetical protein YC2023_085963 [Brassica napus]
MCRQVLTMKSCLHIFQERPLVTAENQNGLSTGDDYAQTFHTLIDTLLTDNQELSTLIDRVRNSAPANTCISHIKQVEAAMLSLITTYLFLATQKCSFKSKLW